MGNQIPESHNKSLFDNSCEVEIKPIVESIVTDLVNAVHIKESLIMSDSKESHQNMDNNNLDKSSYFEANESTEYPINVSTNEASNSLTAEPLLPNNAIHKHFEDFMDLTDCVEKENEYSPKRSKGSTALSDWKYSTNSRSTSGYSDPYKSSQFNEILDSWNLNKNENKDRPKADPSNPTRISVIRSFDPLYGREDNFPSPPERRKLKLKTDKTIFKDLNDSTGLVNCFSKFKIGDSLQSQSESRSDYPIIDTITDQKPDVLAFTVHKEQDTDLRKQIIDLEEQSKQQNIKLEECERHLKIANNENKELLQLITTYHNINEELIRLSTEKMNSNETEISKIVDERNEFEIKFVETKLNCDQLKDELSSLQMTNSENQTQYLMANEKIKQLEKECNNLMAKKDSIEKHSIEGKNFENEMIAYKVQNKRMEMKIKSLENQLEQKNKENTELSSMVDELIIKVQK